MRAVRPSPLFGSVLVVIICSFANAANAQWVEQQSGTTVRFRGVSAVSARTAWASGDRGTFARTVDGGQTWRAETVKGAEELDFRDVDAFDERTAYLLSIGEGEKSRIYKTTDGGQNWTLQFVNKNPKAFFDAMAFWDKDHGIAMSDPVNGRFLLITTSDGGRTWKEVAPEKIPAALTGEAAFAASGTCITVEGKSHVWFGTGGGAEARVFRSTDRGRNWTVTSTPITSGKASRGIFSVAFMDNLRGVIVGGDYEQEALTTANVAVTTDGGQTWKAVTNKFPAGYRSGVSYLTGKRRAALVAVGPSGTDYSTDYGLTWTNIGQLGFHSVSFARRGEAAGWAVGEAGRIAKYVGSLPSEQRR
jgi:photosystem II stability/assembly factor-like uncharacterized protein